MAAFTTIATAASLAITAGGATNSFIQAGKQRERLKKHLKKLMRNYKLISLRADQFKKNLSSELEKTFYLEEHKPYR